MIVNIAVQVYLQTVSVDIDNKGSNDAGQEYNKEILSELVEDIRHREFSVQTPAELLGVFKCKEYSNTAYYAGPFTIGPDMNIRVKVCGPSKPPFAPERPCRSCTQCLATAGSAVQPAWQSLFSKG